jgi:glycine oxidase
MNGHIVVLGGGVMGLSIAYQMQKEGWRVTLVDRMMERRNASWASAGVLLPSSPRRTLHPMDQLCALGTEIHRRWATELRETTGIDNGLRFDGGLYVARSNGEAGALAGLEQHWLDEGIEFESIPLDQVSLRFPVVAHPQLRGFPRKAKFAALDTCTRCDPLFADNPATRCLRGRRFA